MGSIRRFVLPAIVIASASPALAHPPGGWGGPGWSAGWGGPGWGRPAADSRSAGRDSREGRVSAEHFVADGVAAQLGHGALAVRAEPGGSGDAREAATFEAAVIDQLAKAGYDTARPDPAGGQVVEVHVVRDMVAPAEPKRSPVSGAMEVGVSNHGSMMGLQLNYDATKPRGALIETRLEARIRDRATDKLLWEGRAAIVTREGDSHWNDNAVAGRLAGALFERFPAAQSLAER
ncbi:MAG: hypothetical protein KGM17_14520 [Sphingomonadales bacterium]|nr:hypothetical protein [Sphingomonadales bacterium]